MKGSVCVAVLWAMSQRQLQPHLIRGALLLVFCRRSMSVTQQSFHDARNTEACVKVERAELVHQAPSVD